MEAFGLPGILLAPTILFEVGAGLALLVGFKTRYVALLLAGFAIVSAVIFHSDFGDQIQQILFLKNVSIAGGFLLLAKIGAPGFSVDQFLARGKERKT
jgi:putative oxidoreductase